MAVMRMTARGCGGAEAGKEESEPAPCLRLFSSALRVPYPPRSVHSVKHANRLSL